jgi:hypothetical protein
VFFEGRLLNEHECRCHLVGRVIHISISSWRISTAFCLMEAVVHNAIKAYIL